MQHKIRHISNSTLLQIELCKGESIVSTKGALVGRDTNISCVPQQKETFSPFCLENYQAKTRAGSLFLAPGVFGNILQLSIFEPSRWYVSSDAWFASTNGIKTDSVWGGAKHFFSSPNHLLLKVEGEGTLFLASFGSLQKIDLAGSYCVNSEYVVAYEGSLSYEMDATSSGGAKHLCHYFGKGSLLLQTRSSHSLLRWIEPFRRVSGKTREKINGDS